MSKDFEYIVSPWEAEAWIEELKVSNLENIGQKLWFEYHKKLMHLNQQSILEISNMRDETIKQWFVTFKKIPILIYEAIQISIWKRKIFPLLVQPEEEFSNTFIVYSVFYHENIAVSLLENILFHSDSIECLDDTTLDLIDYAISYITRLIFTTEDSGICSKQKSDSSNIAEIIIKESKIEFDIAMKCIAIIGYFANQSNNLPLAYLKRLLSTHDVPYLFAQLIEKKPWTKISDGQMMIYTSQWEKVKDGEEEKIIKIEGQVWICLRELLLNPKCAPYYEITQCRMAQLQKLQKYLHENVLDQISPLIDFRRWLCYINISTHTAEPKPGISIELIPQIQSSIIDKYGKKWKQLTRTQSEYFYSKDMKYIKEIAEILSTAYDLDKIVFDDKNKCALCGDVASKRCSQCKYVWYCGRQCQVKDWSTHKNVCEQITNKSKANDLKNNS